MIEIPTVFVGKRFLHRGKKCKAIGETDSGSVKLLMDSGEEVWTDFRHIHPIDGITKGFQVFEIPLFGEDAAKLAA